MYVNEMYIRETGARCLGAFWTWLGLWKFGVYSQSNGGQSKVFKERSDIYVSERYFGLQCRRWVGLETE